MIYVTCLSAYSPTRLMLLELEIEGGAIGKEPLVLDFFVRKWCGTSYETQQVKIRKIRSSWGGKNGYNWSKTPQAGIWGPYNLIVGWMMTSLVICASLLWTVTVLIGKSPNQMDHSPFLCGFNMISPPKHVVGLEVMGISWGQSL